MSLSIREQVLGAIKLALGSEASPATGGAFRSRLDQIEQSECPCYDLTPGDEKVEDPGEYGDHCTVTRTLQVAVRAIVDAGEVQDDSALDAFYVFAVQQLAGGAATLAGLVMEVTEQGNATVFQPNGKDLIGMEMTFAVKFATKRGDPTQRG